MMESTRSTGMSYNSMSKFKPGDLVTLREPDNWIGVYIPDPPFVVLNVEKYDISDINDTQSWLVDYIEVMGQGGHKEKFEEEDLELINEI